MKKTLSLLLCVCLLLTLTACGGSSKATGTIREEAAAEAPARALSSETKSTRS